MKQQAIEILATLLLSFPASAVYIEGWSATPSFVEVAFTLV